MKRTATLLAAAAAALLAPATALAASSYPDDYFFASGGQWALTGAPASIDAPAAWCASTGAGVVVADVDTGADFSHPDLAGKLIAGVAFLGGTSSSETSPTGSGQAAVTDDNGHGTMTTGVIAADTGNGIGVAAVAPDARALIVKVLGSDGRGYESDVALGMRWAADHGANVINLSIGPEQISAQGVNLPDLTIPSAAAYAANKGVAVVLAAGNSDQSQAVYPNLGGIALDAGALTPQATMSSYSNHGGDVSIYAPGGSVTDPSQMTVQNSVVSTYAGGQYAVADGTSLSAPMVSGTLALLMARGMSSKQAMSAVTGSAVTRNGLPDLDAAAALGVPDSQRCGSPTTPGAPPPSTVRAGGTPRGGSAPVQPVAHTAVPAATAQAPATATPAADSTPASQSPTPESVPLAAVPSPRVFVATPPAHRAGAGIGLPLLSALGAVVVLAPMAMWTAQLVRRRRRSR
ncbi:MAG TPA: S8 family serine peptidase [Candidatus Dormibacteraeota bacterium]|nr:S8 family serine peptidase [Candidatus Dormibacteraeota bacterium]